MQTSKYIFNFLNCVCADNIYVYVCVCVTQEIVKYISRALEEKTLLYFGMENLAFSFTDPVSTEANEGDSASSKLQPHMEWMFFPF